MWKDDEMCGIKADEHGCSKWKTNDVKMHVKTRCSKEKIVKYVRKIWKTHNTVDLCVVR